MTTSLSDTILIAVLSIIFNAGGFAWLALNHFRSVGRKLDSINSRLNIVEKEIYFIRGKLNGDE